MAYVKLDAGRATDIHVPWLLMTAYKPNQRVLVIGGESLSEIFGLAKKSATVSIYVSGSNCSEPSLEEENLYNCSNVEIVKSNNSTGLPFEDDCFDVCVAGGNIIMSSKQDLLAEVYRVLSPSGTLYFSSRNKFHPGRVRTFFKWNKDVDKSYFNAVPEIVHEWGCYRYRKILNRQYRNVHCYSLFTVGNVDKIVEVESRGSSEPMQEAVGGLKGKCLNRVKTSKFYKKLFAQRYGVYASKLVDQKNVIDKIVLGITDSLVSHVERRDEAISVTQKGSAVFTVENCSEEKKYIVKVALGDLSGEQLQRNYDSILALHLNEDINEGIKAKVPFPVCKSECDSYRYFAEEKVCGVPAVDFSSNEKLYLKIMHYSADFVQNLHLSTKHYISDHSSIQSGYICSRVKEVNRILPAQMKKTLNSVEMFLIESFVDKDIPMVFHKGDCSANNILVDVNGSLKCNFIDWDQSNCSYFPFVDIVNLLESFRRHKDKIGMGNILINNYFNMNYSETELSIIEQYLDALGISNDRVFPLTVMYWLDHIYAQNLFIIQNDKRWMEKNVYTVLDYFACSTK